MHHTRSGSHGLYLPATFRPQGLATLTTVSSLARLAGLISCRQRPWGFPFGAFSSPKVARRLPPSLAPLAVTGSSTRPTEVCTVEFPHSASGYFLRASSVRTGRVISPTSRRLLPWDSSLPGILADCLCDRFQPHPPSRFSITAVTRDDFPRLGVSISNRFARLREPGVPLRI
jgi:hypothetical protein